MPAVVTFKFFVGVRGQLDSQAETDSRGTACDQHHLLVHGAWLINCLLQQSAASIEDEMETCENSFSQCCYIFRQHKAS